jgi:hypothetical protein
LFNIPRFSELGILHTLMGAVTALMTSTKNRLLAAFAFFQAWVAMQADLQDVDGIAPVTRARQAGTVIAVVVIGVVALVGLLIFGEVYQAMPLDSAVFQSGGALNGTADSITSGFGDAMGLVPIILLVLLAAVVIGVVQRMRGGA